MSLIREFRRTELQIKQLQERLDLLKNDDRLKDDLDFEESLRKLMAKHGKSDGDVILILDPSYVEKAKKKDDSRRRPRATKTYKNPHTNEVIETKGGNHRMLKAWKDQYGAEVVAAWAVDQQT